MSDTTITCPYHVTSAQITVARGYLRACVEQVSDDPARSARIEALDDDTVYQRILRVWPEGWDHFVEVFASDIRSAGEVEWAAWLAEFDQVAARRLYGSHMRQAATWVSCGRTGAGAVDQLGVFVTDHRRAGDRWADIAETLRIPRHVAAVWAAESRVRRAIAATARPFRRFASR